MILPINNSTNQNFKANITMETVRRANQACIERGKLARKQGLSLAEYNAINREDFVHYVGNKRIDVYEIMQKITKDKEKLRKACRDAWNNVMKK